MYGISNSQQQGGGGGSTINYTKLIGNVKFTVSSPSASSAFFVGTDTATWATLGDMQKALSNTSDLGLIIGNSYTISVDIDGTTQSFSGVVVDGAEVGVPGVKIFETGTPAASFSIYDHCDFSANFPKADNGSIILASFSSSATSAKITTFSGTLRVVSPATITNSAIKVNSSVTMYINSDITVRGTKTDGSITLDANKGGVVSYEMEILDVPTEGLFEIVNGYVPEIPDTPSGVPQWNTIYEDATGTGVDRIDLTAPLKGGELYRITIDGEFYIFCPDEDGKTAIQDIGIVYETLHGGNSSLTHTTIGLTHTKTRLTLSYAAQYNITEAGISNYVFSGASGLKFTKLEVYR